MVVATTWTVIGILGAALVAFFVDSRSDRRALRLELGGRIDTLGTEQRGRIDTLGTRIDALRTELGSEIRTQTVRIDALVLDVGEIKASMHTHEAASS